METDFSTVNFNDECRPMSNGPDDCNGVRIFQGNSQSIRFRRQCNVWS